MSFENLWDTYVADCQRAQNEDSLKAPIQHLIQEYASILGVNVHTGTEDTEAVVGVRPDVNLYDSGGDRMWLGAIELKSPVKSLPGKAGYTKTSIGRVGRWDASEDAVVVGKPPSEHDTNQWVTLRELPNVLYCNGLMLARYESGRLVDATDRGALFFGDVDATADEIAVSDDSIRTDFERILKDALQWEPTPPSSMRQMARHLAPLARNLKAEIKAAMKRPGSAMRSAKEAWTESLMEGATDDDFADGYAQAAVFAMLFARLDGAPTPLTLDSIKSTIKADHLLLFGVIETIMRTTTRDEVRNSLDGVVRYVSAVEPAALAEAGENPWHDFYEFFTAEYDPARRNDTGVYFTPKPVVDFQVAQIHEWLIANGFDDSFATPGVKVIDPATGSGTYLLAVIERTRRYLSSRGRPGIDDDPIYADRLAENLYGIEIGVGAYSIAQLRVARALADMKGTGDAPTVNVLLSDTLTNPWGEAQQKFFLPELAGEQEKANALKASTDVTVVLGNPPYDREEGAAEDNRRQHGGWVRHDHRTNQASGPADKPLLDDFRDRAVGRGNGKAVAKAIPNLYIYFWRWAIWKAFEQNESPAIVSFISPMGFLSGVGTEAMRAWIREQADSVVTYDLLGERRGERRTFNIFTDIKTATGVTTAARSAVPPEPSTLAPWHRVVVTGTPKERLSKLATWSATGIPELTVTEPGGLFDDVVPDVAGELRSHIPLSHIFPVHRKGVQAQRVWPYSETRALAEQRWARLADADPEQRPALLGENGSNKAADSKMGLLGVRLEPLSEIDQNAKPELIVESQYRPFDVHHLVADARVLGRPSRDMWTVHGSHQTYFVSRFVTEGASDGPVALVTPHIPDLDCSNGASGGGADVAPLYRSHDETTPNVNVSLLSALCSQYGATITATDVMMYCNGLLGTGAYSERFWAALAYCTPHVAFPEDRGTFDAIVEVGSYAAWLHSGETVGSDSERFELGEPPIKTEATADRQASGMPTTWTWDSAAGTIEVDRRIRITGVPEDVWEFLFLGKRPIESWLNYRKHNRAKGGRAKTTELDDLRPDWGPETSRDLVDLVVRVWKMKGLEVYARDLIDAVFSLPASLDFDEPAKAERAVIPNVSDQQSPLPL